MAGLTQLKPRIHRRTQRQKESDEESEEELYEPIGTEQEEFSQRFISNISNTVTGRTVPGSTVPERTILRGKSYRIESSCTNTKK